MFHCSIEFVAILNHSHLKKMFTNVNKADVHNLVGFMTFLALLIGTFLWLYLFSSSEKDETM